jgi:hypothetical protein
MVGRERRCSPATGPGANQIKDLMADARMYPGFKELGMSDDIWQAADARRRFSDLVDAAVEGRP